MYDKLTPCHCNGIAPKDLVVLNASLSGAQQDEADEDGAQSAEAATEAMDAEQLDVLQPAERVQCARLASGGFAALDLNDEERVQVQITVAFVSRDFPIFS
eukprot:SAG11_NODE_1055_length_6017_cov_1.548496_2_plen_101_part_00